MRFPGEISISQAAKLLGMHPNTIRLWVFAFLEDGDSSRISCVRQDLNGYYWLSREDVLNYRERRHRQMADRGLGTKA